MKVSVVITKAEKDSTQQLIFRDPCTYIECGEIDCDVCPLHGAAKALRKAQEDFDKVLCSFHEE